jgi:tight adherence protein B
MDQNTALLLYTLVFVGILLAVEGLSAAIGDLRRGPDRAINRRLRMLASGLDPEEVLRLLRRPGEAGGLERLAPLRLLARLTLQAGVRMPVAFVLAAMALLALALTLLLLPTLGLLAAPTGIVAGAGLPLAVLRLRRQRRGRAIAAQLPDAIDLVVRSLRAGQPLNAALRNVARETPDPLGSEIGLLVDEVTYGKTLPEAAHGMAQRVGLDEVHYMVVAINIQHGIGGNLAEILAALGRVLRERATMRRNIQAVSAEGRMSAIVLSAFPLFLAGAIQLTSPDYFGEVAGDPMFPTLLGFIAFMMVANMVIMRRLVNFDF